MTSTVKSCFAVIRQQCMILDTLDKPFIFCSQEEKNLIILGTKNVKDLMEEKSAEFQKAFDKDNNGRSPNKAEFISKMEAPLSLSNAIEVKKYARYLIVRDFQKRNNHMKDSRIKYGDPVWEPSNWPNDLLPWRSFSKNFSDIKKSEIPGKPSINIILKKYIKTTLESAGKDPETFYDEKNFDQKKEEARKKNRGIEISGEDTKDLTERNCQNGAKCNSTENGVETCEEEGSSTENDTKIADQNVEGEKLSVQENNGSISSKKSSIYSSFCSQNSGKGKDGNTTLERLLQIPSEIEQRYEREERERIMTIEKRLQEEAEVDKERIEWETAMKQKKLQKELESAKVRKLADHLRENMTKTIIKKMFKNNQNYFKKVKMGLHQTWRHKLYMSSENKARNLNILRFRMVGPPFSDNQQDIIYEEVKKVWLNTRELQLKDNNYVELVLLPEVFIILYQKFLHIPDSKTAEDKIFDKGSMDPSDMSSGDDTSLLK